MGIHPRMWLPGKLEQVAEEHADYFARLVIAAEQGDPDVNYREAIAFSEVWHDILYHAQRGGMFETLDPTCRDEVLDYYYAEEA